MSPHQEKLAQNVMAKTKLSGADVALYLAEEACDNHAGHIHRPKCVRMYIFIQKGMSICT